MKTSVFVSFCLVIVAVLVSLHAFVKNDTGPMEKMKSQMASIDRARAQADLRAQLLAHELEDYQQQVATLLPEDARKGTAESAYPLRQLASTVADSDDALKIERASGLFEKAKTAFREKDYEASDRLLNRLIDRFPESAHVPEAHFLLAEGQFQLKDYAASAGTIEKMIEAYPENELTGFALLRLGRIFEIQNRLEDAGDIYRSVVQNFKQPVLIQQAKLNLKAVTL